jgi:hypothetical protein
MWSVEEGLCTKVRGVVLILKSTGDNPEGVANGAAARLQQDTVEQDQAALVHAAYNVPLGLGRCAQRPHDEVARLLGWEDSGEADQDASAVEQRDCGDASFKVRTAELCDAVRWVERALVPRPQVDKDGDTPQKVCGGVRAGRGRVVVRHAGRGGAAVERARSHEVRGC